MKKIMTTLGFIALLSAYTIQAVYKPKYQPGGKTSKSSAETGILSTLEDEIENIFDY